jgi:hypothetical protein
MLKTLRAFLEFCYIARSNILDMASLATLTNALERFHTYRVIFQECGIRPDGFALPRQHSLVHYPSLIRSFGAPNGLCSSITESKHIKAVKEPWRRSNRFEALGQMLLTNQRLDKLAASHVDFASRGMLHGTCLENVHREFLIFLHRHTTDYLTSPEPPSSDAPALPAQSLVNEEDEGGPVVGSRVMASVKLTNHHSE